MTDTVEVAVVTARFEARPGAEEALAAALARYVVLTRRAAACRNVDLVASATHRGHLLVIEKWESADAARAHLDAPETVEMAAAVVGLVTARPDVDLHDTISAHDLT